MGQGLSGGLGLMSGKGKVKDDNNQAIVQVLTVN